MKIHVRFTGLIAASLGKREESYDLTEGTTIKEMLDIFDLPVKSSWLAVNVNGSIKDKNTVLKDGDTLIILPVGGGG